MNSKCPYCHKEIEIQVFKPEEVFEPEPKGMPIRRMPFIRGRAETTEVLNYNDLINKETNLNDYLQLLNKSDNKIAYLVYAFKRLHDYYVNDEQDESKDAYSFMGKIWKNANKDYGYLMKVIWDTSTASIAGSHLNYINKTVIERRKKEMQSAVAHAVQPKRDISKAPGYK